MKTKHIIFLAVIVLFAVNSALYFLTKEELKQAELNPTQNPNQSGLVDYTPKASFEK